MTRTSENSERPQSDQGKIPVLLGIYNQNWEHVRHIETERVVFLQVQSAIYVGVLIGISRGALPLFVEFGLILLLGLSVTALLVSVKLEAAIETYLGHNRQLVAEMASITQLKVHELAEGRVVHGIWKYIRLRYLIPAFYLFTSAILVILLIQALWQGLLPIP